MCAGRGYQMPPGTGLRFSPIIRRWLLLLGNKRFQASLRGILHGMHGASTT